ncbi:unnamed protein product [Adineta steineri]|uniref:G-protein coupled receptors family 1 profile domain-containing protein n=1 Tax=Adineta steineri TaxID=433720 RepID=A0A815T8J6_9BILA|nr:unnamed protein product [Adineta steineri]CAF1499719.1 unnamed protein product [Adineta steineri]CAF1540719.1 unnamed protein product [Adineta steineri]CAF1644124.1 unnamed protein product [Adineta steineri]
MTIPNIVRSWLFQGFQIPSVLFGISSLYYLLTDRGLRNALNNHVIIAMVFVGLILQFIDVTALIYTGRTGTVLVSTRAFCFTWASVHAIGVVGVVNLMAWASIERHILIFHPNLVRTKTNRFFLHYFPLIICMMCPGVFYITMYFIVPCSITMNYKTVDCGLYSCVVANPSVGFVALIIRVLASKCRARQRIQWRNYRRMAVQLLSISFLYMSLWCPSIFLYTAYLLGLSRNIGASYYPDSNYFNYYAIILTPIVCALSLPELRTKFKICFPCCRRRRAAVGPQALMMTRTKAGPIAGPTAAIATIAQ